MRSPLAAALCLLAVACACAATTGTARAAGGAYVLDGGTARQQAQVRAALAASSFDFALVPQQLVVHIGAGSDSYASPGGIWLDARLLDAGRFAWGTVLHEFAHQVDFFLLDGPRRAQLQALLGGTDWCYEKPGLQHDAHGCERFADTLAAAYWPSADNTARAAVPAARFRAVLDGMLGGARQLAASYRVRR